MGKAIVEKRLKALELFAEHGEYLDVVELIDLNTYIQVRFDNGTPSPTLASNAKFHLTLAINRFEKIMEE